MAYGIPQLRQQNLFGGFGGFGGFGNSPNNAVLDPTGQPLDPPPAYDPQVLDPTGQPLASPEANVASSPMSPSGGSLDEWIGAINKGYTPSTVDRDRLRGHLDAYPEREEPSFMRKFAAMGMGLGASRDKGDPLATMEKVMYAPYMRDVADWKEKANPFQQAATLENQANTQERTLMGSAVTGFNADQRNREQIRNNDMRFEIQRQANEIRNAVANGWENITGSNDPTYTLRNKATGEIRRTQVPTGSLIELDSIRERGKVQIEAAKQTGAAAAERQSQGIVQRGDNLFEFPDGSIHSRNADGSWKLEKPPGSGPARQLGTTIPSSSNAKPPSALEQGRVLNKNLSTAYQTDPEGQKYIRKNGTNYSFRDRPVRTPENPWLPGKQEVSDIDVFRYDQYRKKLDPSYTSPDKPHSDPYKSRTGSAPSNGREWSDKPQSQGLPVAEPPPGIPAGARIQSSGNEWRYSLDNGKTWIPVSY